LSGLYISINDSIIARSTNAVKDFTLNQDALLAVCNSANFSEYFVALRLCLTGPKAERRALHDETWIQTVTDSLLATFWTIDQDDRHSKRCHIDILKGEMILLFERFVELDVDQFFAALVERRSHCLNAGDSSPTPTNYSGTEENPITKLLEVFVTSSDNTIFNNTYMVHFYRILMALADHNSIFLMALLRHDNWTWSLSAFVLNQSVAGKNRLYRTLLDGTIKYLEFHKLFRRKVYKKVVESSSLFLQNRVDIGAIELLSAIFRIEGSEQLEHQRASNASPSCISSFISSKTGGMSRLSSATRSTFTKLSGNECSYHDISDLGLCLSCILLPLQTLSQEEIDEMIQSWVEVDDTNFVLTQIITRTKDEWKLDCAEDAIMEIVDLARNLQHFLLPSETSFGNKQ